MVIDNNTNTQNIISQFLGKNQIDTSENSSLLDISDKDNKFIEDINIIENTDELQKERSQKERLVKQSNNRYFVAYDNEQEK